MTRSMHSQKKWVGQLRSNYVSVFFGFLQILVILKEGNHAWTYLFDCRYANHFPQRYTVPGITGWFIHRLTASELQAIFTVKSYCIFNGADNENGYEYAAYCEPGYVENGDRNATEHHERRIPEE